MDEKSVPEYYPVVIIGGGIGGLTLAAILRKLKIPYRVLERTPTLSPQGAGISLAPNCLRALEQLGIFDDIARNSQQLFGIDIYGDHEYWGRLDFGLCKNWFGYHVRSIERHQFHHYLYEAADGANSTYLGWDVADIVDDPQSSSVLIETKDGKRITAGVVVGADGIRSVTRRIVSTEALYNVLQESQLTWCFYKACTKEWNEWLEHH